MHTNIQTIVTVKCLDQVLQLINAPRITSGGVNDVRAEFEFCPLWDGLAKSAVFYTDPKNVYKQVLEEDACDVPPEVLAVPGLMYMGVFGVNAAGDVVRTSGVLVLNIEPGAITEATAVSDPTPELYQQILAEVQKAREAAEEANPVDVDLTGAPLEYVAVLEDEDGDPIPTNAVTYDEQSLTEEQKAQARENIGAATAAEAKAAAAAAATAALEQAKESGEFDGAAGKDGKSAYQYAQDGGYTGTEEEFAKVLASGGYAPETETVLSDNLLDKSLMTKGQAIYYGGSGYQLAASTYSYYGFIPLRGAGTYRTKFQQQVHESTGTRIALVNDNNTWVANTTGTCGEIVEDKNWVDFEFVVTEAHISAGATKVAFDVYSGVNDGLFNKTMIVKDREYPSEYIPFGYIEVATDSGRKQNNVLCEKTAVFLGDSLCAGTTVGADSPYYNYGWGGIIGEANRMNWKNYGKNGGTITHRGADGTCIAKIADTAIAEHPNADYVIFEGGCNDADQMKDAGLGVVSSDYATFDTTTFSGALEALILKLVTAYPNAKIGYIIPQKMYTGYSDYTAKNHIHRKYFDRAVEICRKWGIPVVDIWNGSMLNPKLSTASIYYVEENGQHLTEAGYLAITPMIDAWMRNLYVPGMVAVAGGNTGNSSGGVTKVVDTTIYSGVIETKLNSMFRAYSGTAFYDELESIPEVIDICFDAIDYQNRAVTTLPYNGEMLSFCGNMAHLNALMGTSFANTGEPFLGIVYASSLTFMTTDTSGAEHTVCIDVPEKHIKEVNKEYLPNVPVIDFVKLGMGALNDNSDDKFYCVQITEEACSQIVDAVKSGPVQIRFCASTIIQTGSLVHMKESVRIKCVCDTAVAYRAAHDSDNTFVVFYTRIGRISYNFTVDETDCTVTAKIE